MLILQHFDVFVGDKRKKVGHAHYKRCYSGQNHTQHAHHRPDRSRCFRSNKVNERFQDTDHALYPADEHLHSRSHKPVHKRPVCTLSRFILVHTFHRLHNTFSHVPVISNEATELFARFFGDVGGVGWHGCGGHHRTYFGRGGVEELRESVDQVRKSRRKHGRERQLLLQCLLFGRFERLAFIERALLILRLFHLLLRPFRERLFRPLRRVLHHFLHLTVRWL